VLDERLFNFLDTGAQGFATEIVIGTAGRDYDSERNMISVVPTVRAAHESW
jgi:hypothetical protein